MQRDARLGFLAVEAVARVFGVGDVAVFDELEPFRQRPGPGAGTGEKLTTAIALYIWAHQGGPADEICDHALWLLNEGGLRLSDDPLIAVAAYYVLQCAERDETLDLWEQSRAEAYRAGSLLGSSTIHTWYGHTLWRRGDLAQSRAEFEAGIGELRQWGYSETIMAASGGYLAPILIEQGELDAAERHLAEMPNPQDDSLPMFNWLNARAHLSLAQGRPEEVLAVCDDFERRASWVHNPIDYPWLIPRALALDRLDRREEAVEVAEAWLVQARQWGAPGTVGTALRVLGMVQRERGWTRCARPSRCSSTPRRGSSGPRRWRRSAGRCAGPGGPPMRGSRCAGRSSWRRRAMRMRSSSTCARSCTPRVRGREATPWPASRR
ncbi:hypothetical protein LRS13_08255 [Svornostia abyssi]|uniref:Uncharacterized protein n=1 Tax=Svornostia abyssi TaxID=2898438 RepID=A0ABY5PMF5_9ACTN|nr:hypothetical protein LRS13_08255 [Parviterribacteraceae bacterium J379]